MSTDTDTVSDIAIADPVDAYRQLILRTHSGEDVAPAWREAVLFHAGRTDAPCSFGADLARYRRRLALRADYDAGQEAKAKLPELEAKRTSLIADYQAFVGALNGEARQSVRSLSGDSPTAAARAVANMGVLLDAAQQEQRLKDSLREREQIEVEMLLPDRCFDSRWLVEAQVSVINEDDIGG